jgi:hypothetical protein
MIRPRLVVAAAAVLAATACGAPAPPGELVPALRTQLTQVDQAIIAEDYTQARDDLDALAAQTATARDESRITPDQADRILAAITRLAANLPEPASPTPATPPAPPSEPITNTGDRRDTPQSTDPSPEGDTQGRGEQEGNGEENGRTGEEGKREEKGTDKEKGNSNGKGKNAEGATNENSSGPDDGHGN